MSVQIKSPESLAVRGFFARPAWARIRRVKNFPVSSQLSVEFQESRQQEREEKKMSKLFQSVADHAMYVLSFLGIIVVLFLAALFLERVARKKKGGRERVV